MFSLNSLRKKFINSLYFHQWSLMMYISDDFSTNFSIFKKIIPPKDRFWADPFIVYKNEKYYVFFEELIYSEKIGHISLIEIDKNGNHSKPEKILDLPFHLSYPFIFEFEKNYYFIHASISKNRASVDLFKCIEFPYKWEFYKELIPNTPLVDTTLFYHKNKWWLFACVANNDGTSLSKNLVLYYNDSLINNSWISHPQNPIISDISKARPAGNIFNMQDRLIRPSQNCSKYYGYGLCFNEIIKLTETEYEEKLIESFEPKLNNDFIGMHTFNRKNNLTIIDVIFRRPRSLLNWCQHVFIHIKKYFRSY
jgi:hypothetical protein